MKESTTITNAKDMIYSFYEKVEQNYNEKAFCNGMSTGFYDLDAITGGLHPSELTVIAGRHSMGKTALAINLTNNLALENKPILYISYEMGQYFLASRLLSSYAEVDSTRIHHGCMQAKDWEKLAVAISELSGFVDKELLNVISGCNLNWNELFDEIRFFAKNHSDGIVIIDYFQLIKLMGESDRIVELSILAGAFKRLAIELDIPIILLSQVVKKTRDLCDKRPALEDLAECDALAQHADNVIFIYRNDYYQKEDDDFDPKLNIKGEAEIIIAKQKNGPIGTIKLLFQPNITKFKNPVKSDDL